MISVKDKIENSARLEVWGIIYERTKHRNLYSIKENRHEEVCEHIRSRSKSRLKEKYEIR